MIFGIFAKNKRSPKWPATRLKHLDQYPSCAACGSTKNLEVHHIEPFSISPEKELDPNNLITLCSKNCHFYIGHLMDYNSWNINVIEDSRVYLYKVKNRPQVIRSTNYEKNNLYDYIVIWFSGLFWHYRSRK